MSNKDWVLMLCGPHAHERLASPQFHRLQAAVEIARPRQHWLLVCGDANRGNDVNLFVEYAKREGRLQNVLGLYSEEGSTLADVQNAAGMIVPDHPVAPGWPNDTTAAVRLVTDDWHMPRAAAMLERELAKIRIPNCAFPLRPEPVVGGVPITPDQMRRERDGLLAFQNGTYRRNSGLGWGKPS